METPSSVLDLISTRITLPTTQPSLLLKRKTVLWLNTVRSGILFFSSKWKDNAFKGRKISSPNPLDDRLWSNIGQADMTARTFDHNQGTTQSALRKLSAKASHQHFRPQLAYTKQVPRREFGVRDRPENGCFVLKAKWNGSPKTHLM